MVDYWKAELGLQAWDIQVVYCRERDLEARNKGCTAVCYAAYYVEKAEIKFVTDFDDSDCPCRNNHCYEEAVVHELMHVRFDRALDVNWVQSHPGNEMLYENAIDQTAKALVRQRRAFAHESFIINGPTAH